MKEGGREDGEVGGNKKGEWLEKKPLVQPEYSENHTYL